jgi:Holliday junction DNA helicase RuvA
MIATLRGVLLFKLSETVIIETSGVGYEVFFPKNRQDLLPGIGDEIFLHIFTSVREDALQLFGFLEPEEKDLFLLLVSVSGIGPKSAMNILAGISPSEMVRAISAGDIYRLTQLPGIGKKTAERLCVELKDKLPFIPAVKHAGAQTITQPDDQLQQDVVSVLVNLGYPVASARDAIKRVRRDLDVEVFEKTRLEELVRLALRSLA